MENKMSSSTKYYYEKVKPNEEKYNQEKERIRTYCKNRYDNNEEYKQKKREQALKNYYNRKNTQKTFN
jgi:hypothetical protein